MTRIIAGSAGGRRLEVPKRGTRPTADRVREAMFSTLGSWLAAQSTDWSSLAVLDLFAGSGALGLEAASRGAARVVLVERNPQAAAVINRNVASCGLDQVEVMVASVMDLPARPPGYPTFGLCLADPPYEIPAGDISAALDRVALTWLEPGAMVVVERPFGQSVSPLPEAWPVTAVRRYADTCLWYGHVQQV